MTDYEPGTRNAYRSEARAGEYKRYHTAHWSWGRVATYLEQRQLRRLLATRSWCAEEVILDAPCGTGILGRTLAGVDARVVAADIAWEMMALAHGEYDPSHFLGFVQSDILQLPFGHGVFDGVIALGFLHRVPQSVREGSLAELHRVCRGLAVVSFSISSPAQRLKHRLLNVVRKSHVPAPWAIPLAQAEAEIRAAGFRIRRRAAIAPLLSAESLFLLDS